jgi:hypothetical protein
MWIHLALVLLAGVWLPEPVRLVLEAAADLIAGTR